MKISMKMLVIDKDVKVAPSFLVSCVNLEYHKSLNVKSIGLRSDPRVSQNDDLLKGDMSNN
jgi:hypothetical protein